MAPKPEIRILFSINVTDRIEILTAYLGFGSFDHGEHEQSAPKRLKHRPITGNGNIAVLAPILPFPVVGCCRNHLSTVLLSSPWSRTTDLQLELSVTVTVPELHMFLFLATIELFPVVGRYRNHLPTLSSNSL